MEERRGEKERRRKERRRRMREMRWEREREEKKIFCTNEREKEREELFKKQWGAIMSLQCICWQIQSVY